MTAVVVVVVAARGRVVAVAPFPAVVVVAPLTVVVVLSAEGVLVGVVVEDAPASSGGIASPTAAPKFSTR